MLFVKESWHGFEMERFMFEEREAIVVFPKAAREGRPWLLKTEYWDAFPDVELRLVEQGFHLAYVKNHNRWATQEECAAKARFVKHVSCVYGLNSKCVPVGMSCGGGYAVKFSGLYPELVKCMFIDAPVMNFLSIPGKYGNPVCDRIWNQEFVFAYPGIKHYQLAGWNEHPISYADSLREHAIPILMVYGEEDETVLYNENGRLLAEAMEGSGLLKEIAIPYRGHHPHGLIKDNQPIVDFILSHA